MKISHILYIILFLLVACKSQEKDDNRIKITAMDSSHLKAEPQNFFPVTNFIKGQIFEIKNGGVNPMKFVTINKHTDSAWLKMEDINKEVSDFLTPEIDTANLTTLFAEKKFMDQTLDAITFTYDPIKSLPDSFVLRHWDVYVDPNKSMVRRVYLVKNLPGKKTQLLTWETGKSCNIKNVSADSSGKPLIEKEISIKWRF
ncbi:MAG: hypothetical protein ABIN36_08175 [Ferruginibacter sp.]